MAASVVVGPGQKGKHEMLQILSTELNRVEAKISSDSKLKKMAELQSTVVTDSKNKQAFLDQVISFFIFLTLCWLACVENSRSPFPTACLVGWLSVQEDYGLVRPMSLGIAWNKVCFLPADLASQARVCLNNKHYSLLLQWHIFVFWLKFTLMRLGKILHSVQLETVIKLLPQHFELYILWKKEIAFYGNDSILLVC